MELKWKSNLNVEGLEKLADEVLAQIDEKWYDAEMKKEGIREILKFGIAFLGKR